jgi:beta-glucosidase
MATRDFPVGFLWGAATAAHQVEGGNTNNDWWAWEHMPGSPCVESSGDACDHYHRYAGDLDLLAGLGLNTYRFSLEWSRIEPAEREYSTAALDHYRRMCAECRERRLEPIVTFHHFTTPAWLAARGGWTDPATADRFARFCERAAAHLGDVIGRACTINEPNIVAALGHRDGIFPPGLRDPEQYTRAVATLIAAHQKGAAAIRAAKGRVPVGLTLAMQGHDAVDGGEARRDEAQREMEDQYLEAVRGDDFLGVQAYTRLRFGPEGLRPPEPGARLTQMGWEFWPEALGACVRHAAARVGGIPLLVTENGIATADDTERVEYLERALASLRDCMRDGIEVQGYLHWSLLDNFEWVHGFRPTFGLIAVDRPTQKRVPKPSATRLAAIAATGTLD